MLTPAIVLILGFALTSPVASSQLVTLEDASTHAIVTDQGQSGLTVDMGIGELQVSEVTTPLGVFNLLSFEGCAR